MTHTNQQLSTTNNSPTLNYGLNSSIPSGIQSNLVQNQDSPLQSYNNSQSMRQHQMLPNGNPISSMMSDYSFFQSKIDDDESQIFSSSSDHEDCYTDEEDDSSSSCGGGDNERKSKRRRKICRNFTCQEFIELMHLSQREAAKELNVCLSTFKRQFSAIRPKLSWPTPSQRKILLHRRKFQNIIEQNQEEFFPSTFFEFGKDNSQIFEEILPDPKVLSEECLYLRKVVDQLRKENQSLREKLAQSNVAQDSRSMGNPFVQDLFPSAEEDCDSTHEAYDDSCVQQDFYMDTSRNIFGI